jgi:exodeoxyribonuclease III
VTWNCSGGPFHKKTQRLTILNADIAVLQECPRPPLQDPSIAWFGTDPRRGVAIFSRSPYSLEPGPVRSGSASFFSARVIGPTSFRILAVWTQLEPSYPKALQRGIRLYRDVLGIGPVVLLGDLNSSVAWDNRHAREDHRALDKQLQQEFGLVSAYHAATGECSGEESQPTHYWQWKESAPFHLDYCYLPEAWLPWLQGVTVGSYLDWRDVSDHRPLVIDVSPQ